MSTTSILRIVVIVLECCNIFLFTLLLLTPAPKHSMVKALIISCLFRSVLDILPSIIFKIVTNKLEVDVGSSANDNMISFCVADSVLLRYVTVVKAAFAVSFTLPCLWLALVQIWPKRSADDYPRLTRRTVLTLCAAPFIWALPVLLTPIAPVVRHKITATQFFITYCDLESSAFTIVSLVFTLVPLALAVIITMIMAVVVWRFSETMLEHAGWLFVKTKRFARFSVLVFVTMISAALYGVSLVLWFHGHNASHHREPPMGSSNGTWNAPEWEHDNPALTHINYASVVWEATTPLLFFAIFAAQEEIAETWRGWLSRIIAISSTKHDGCFKRIIWRSQNVAYRESATSNIAANRSMVSPELGEPSSARAKTTLPGKIVSRPVMAAFTSRSPNGERQRTDSLRPPPRSQTNLINEPPQTAPRSRSRLPFLRSMTTFGSQFSATSYQRTSSAGDFYSCESIRPHSTGDTQREWSSRGSIRAETPGSSRTFGRPSGTRC